MESELFDLWRWSILHPNEEDIKIEITENRLRQIIREEINEYMR
jgi:hypothetical protein